jgi:hypothetical protein
VHRIFYMQAFIKPKRVLSFALKKGLICWLANPGASGSVAGYQEKSSCNS